MSVNKIKPTVYNIGFYQKGKYTATIDKKVTKVYKIWSGMLERCYDSKSQLKRPMYIGCSVAKEWHNFQVFAEWFENNYIEGFVLDKDILIKGNKVYSPETCCFVPQEINMLFTKRQSKRGSTLIGVHKHKRDDIFQSTVALGDGKTTYLGQFKTEQEAYNVYKQAKEIHIKNVAEKYKVQITEACYQALINYKVEITD